jgi:hypothetical protein
MKKIIIAVLMNFVTIGILAQIPSNISWQGLLQDSDGNNLDGTYDITVKIYDVQTGGEALWAETHENVSVHYGVADIILGSITPVNITFNEQMWLEIQIEDGEVFERMKITASPYSLYSKDIEDNSITADKIADGVVNSEHLCQMDATEGQVLTWATSWQPADLPEETDSIFLASPAGSITQNMQNSWTAAYGWGNHAYAGYLTDFTETDPIFAISPAGSITQNMQNSWTTAYGWGNHTDAGYLTDFTETDPIFAISPAGSITQNMQNSWTTAYGWGDHSEEGYLTQYTDLGAADGEFLKWNGTVSKWEPGESSGGIADGEALILRDSEGNIRFRLDPDNGIFEMLDDDFVWYGIEVNSPPKEYKWISNNQYAITEGNKTTYKNVDNQGNVKLVKEEIINGNESTTKYYNASEKVSREIITNQTTMEDGISEVTKKESKYNAEGNSIKEETKTIRTDGTEKIVTEEKTELDGTTTLNERRIEDNQKEDDGTITKKNTITEYNSDETIKSKSATEENAGRGYTRTEKQDSDGIITINEKQNTNGLGDYTEKKTISKDNGSIIEETTGTRSGDYFEGKTKYYNDDGSLKAEKEQIVTVTTNQDGSQTHIIEHKTTNADGSSFGEKFSFTNNSNTFESYVNDKKTYERIENNNGIFIKEYDSEGRVVKEEKYGEDFDDETLTETFTEENTSRDDDGNVILTDKSETSTEKSNKNNKAMKSIKNYQYLNEEILSMIEGSKSVYTPDGSLTIQEKTENYVAGNENPAFQQFQSQSFPYGGGGSTLDQQTFYSSDGSPLLRNSKESDSDTKTTTTKTTEFDNNYFSTNSQSPTSFENKTSGPMGDFTTQSQDQSGFTYDLNGGTFNVQDGNSSFGGNFDATGNGSFDGNFDVIGNSTFGGNMDVSGTLQVGNLQADQITYDNLGVSGNSNFGGDSFWGGSDKFTSGGYIAYDAGNDEYDTWFSGSGTFDGGFYAAGNAGFGGNVAVSGSASFDGDGIFSGNGSFGGNVFCDQIIASLKGFRIDLPSDPDNKYLYHACIESNEVSNVYSGNVTTNDEGDGTGFATVTLPDYFTDINDDSDIRYQLTIVGTTFARAIVYSEVDDDNEFVIRTDQPNITVSWMVVAVRNDEYIQNNPFEDVRDK